MPKGNCDSMSTYRALVGTFNQEKAIVGAFSVKPSFKLRLRLQWRGSSIAAVRTRDKFNQKIIKIILLSR